LLVSLVGVIETLNPVMSVKVVVAAKLKVSVLVVLTTCNTDPAGKDSLAILLDAVVNVPAKVTL
jgi:hypothetical protein